MIKYLGTLGFFIRPNDSITAAHQFLRIYSSSALSSVLLSASINHATGQISASPGNVYVAGLGNSSIVPLAWNHVTISIPEKISTHSDNNFIVKFGGTASSNFNIQNIYLLETALVFDDPLRVHEEFSGTVNSVTVDDEVDISISIIDDNENIISDDNVIYQPYFGQNSFIANVAAATTASLNLYISSSYMTNDATYIDLVSLQPGERVISLSENRMYELGTASPYLSILSIEDGGVIKVNSGHAHGGKDYLVSSSVIVQTTLRPKVSHFEPKIL